MTFPVGGGQALSFQRSMSTWSLCLRDSGVVAPSAVNRYRHTLSQVDVFYSVVCGEEARVIPWWRMNRLSLFLNQPAEQLHPGQTGIRRLAEHELP
jgi:hypothetical protein